VISDKNHQIVEQKVVLVVFEKIPEIVKTTDDDDDDVYLDKLQTKGVKKSILYM
jgi:hypothetical protein